MSMESKNIPNDPTKQELKELSKKVKNLTGRFLAEAEEILTHLEKIMQEAVAGPKAKWTDYLRSLWIEENQKLNDIFSRHQIQQSKQIYNKQ